MSHRIELDESTATSSYANFCRVTGAPEELILDFALSTAPADTAGEPIRITQRVILNYTTAKRFLLKWPSAGTRWCLENWEPEESRVESQRS